MEEIAVLFEGEAVERMISRMAHEIIEHSESLDRMLLVGIERGGVPLAGRLQAQILRYTGKEVPLSALDSTLFRDDRARQREKLTDAYLRPKFDIDGLQVILVDDVLYTGRTIRSAIDALILLGRPAKIELCVMVDRGHRELPIRADYVGKNIPTAKDEEIFVEFAADTRENRIRLMRR